MQKSVQLLNTDASDKTKIKASLPPDWVNESRVDSMCWECRELFKSLDTDVSNTIKGKACRWVGFEC